MGCFWKDLVRAECETVNDLIEGVSGDLYAFGYNQGGSTGRIGLGTALSAGPTLIGSNFKSVSGGVTHSLALTDSGDLYATGDNVTGCLGLGDTISRNAFTFVGSGYKAISAGNTVSFAIKENGDIYAAGNNSNGRLGLGDNSNTYSTFTLLGSGYSDVDSGGSASGSTLFLKENGDLLGTGGNSFGEIGLGSSLSLVYVPTLIDINCTDISFGNDNGFFVKDGNAYGMGRNLYYELGLGHNSVVYYPALIKNGVSTVSSHGYQSLLLTIGGEIWGSGDNWEGKLGLVFEGFVQIMTLVGTGYSSVTCGASASLAIKDGKAYATGKNNYEQAALVGSGPFFGFEECTGLDGPQLVSSSLNNASFAILTP